MICRPEVVTGYVDGALDGATRAEVESHLAECPTCREQAEAERALRERLHGLPEPEPRPELEVEVRRTLRRGPPRRWRWALPLAASLAALGLWGRGTAAFVAWELARDHAKCFAMRALPARVWGNDPVEIAAWFEAEETRLPSLPAGAAGLELVGGRYCPLLDRFSAHIYYAEGNRHLSLFVIKGPLRLDGPYDTRTRGETVHIFRSAGATVALVSERPEDVAAFSRRFDAMMAALPGPSPPVE